MAIHTTDRLGRQTVTLPDGRKVYGRLPGLSGACYPEHLLRDILARTVRGLTEGNLDYGRPDVINGQTVFEVESLATWRHGVRQVLAYMAQTGLEPALALFGEARSERVLKMYLKLRDSHPRIHLWWFSTNRWEPITSRSACTTMYDPDWWLVQDACKRAKPRPAFLSDYA
jgi:hypothetical protein